MKNLDRGSGCERGALNVKLIVIVAAIALASFGGYSYYKKSSTDLVEVKTVSAVKKTLQQTVSAPIETGAPIKLSLNFESSGKVVKIYAEKGDMVKKGELLAQLDNSDEEESLKQADAQAEAAESAVDIAKANTEMSKAAYSISVSNKNKLVNGITDKQLAVTLAQIEQADQAVLDAEANLSAVIDLTSETLAQADLALEIAEDSLDSAEDQYDKILAAHLLQPLVVTSLDVDNAQLAVDAADAQVELAEQTVETTEAQNEQAIALAQAQVNAAKGTQNVLEAQYELQTAPPGSDDKNIANQAVKQASAQVRVANAQLNSALSQQEIAESQRSLAAGRLSDTMLIAPTNGMIVEINNKVGELLGSSSSIAAAASSVSSVSALTSGSSAASSGGSGFMTLIDFTNVDVIADVDETDITKLKKGMKAVVNIDAFSGVPFKGKVTYISKVGKSSSTGGRIFETTVRIDKGSYDVSEGMTGDTEVLLTERTDAVVIPFESVLGSGSSRFVYVVDGGKALKKEIEVGITNDTEYEVLKGLKAGDAIVTEGTNALKDGANVKIKE